VVETAAGLATILALVVAVAAWIYPRSPGSGSATEAPASPPATSMPAAPVAPSIVSSAPSEATHTAADAAVAFDRQEFTLPCSGLAAPFIDVDEPRVLPSAGADVRYLCLDQRFELQDGSVAGYIESAQPAALDHCREGIRRSPLSQDRLRHPV
jgi:hypothetical protein